MDESTAEEGAPVDTAGWDLYADNGTELCLAGLCGQLFDSHSLEFVGNTDWQTQLASPRTDTRDAGDSARTLPPPPAMQSLQGRASSSSSTTSAASGSTTSAATTQAASNVPLAGPGFQFARGNDGRITIGAIAPGGPANAEGSLAAGDELLSVDDLDCSKASARDVRAAILGVQGSVVRLKVYRGVERRTFEVFLVRGSTEGWSLSDKVKDLENRIKERDSVIDLLRMQLTSAQEREARHHELISLGCSGGVGCGRGGSAAAAEGVHAEDGGDAAAPSAQLRKTAGVKAAEAALGSFFDLINPISTADRAASRSPPVPASPMRLAGTTPAQAAGSRSSSAAATAAGDDADSTSPAPAAEELAAAQQMLQEMREREGEMAEALATQSAQLQRVRAEAAAMRQALVELQEALAQNTDELRHSLSEAQHVLLRDASARARAGSQLAASQSEVEAAREALAQETQRRKSVEDLLFQARHRLAESEGEQVVERQRERHRSEARARAAAVEAQLAVRLGAAVEECVQDAEAALACLVRARSEAGARGDALRQCLADALLVRLLGPRGSWFRPSPSARSVRVGFAWSSREVGVEVAKSTHAVHRTPRELHEHVRELARGVHGEHASYEFHFLGTERTHIRSFNS